MRTKRKPKVIAREIHLNESGLHIDGVYLPWEISNTVDVESQAPDFHEVTVTFFAERVFVEPVPGSHVTGTFTAGAELREYRLDTVLDGARAEAVAIVKEGLADIIEQLPKGSHE